MEQSGRNPTQVIRKTRRATRLSGISIVAAAVMGWGADGRALAQEASGMPRAPAPLPEALLIPIDPGDRAPSRSGWILSYRNGLSGPDVPASEIQVRSVRITTPEGMPVDARIVWRIVRTRNDACGAADPRACPDSLSILSLPEGFAAFPAHAKVAEGASLRIYIVPAGLS